MAGGGISGGRKTGDRGVEELDGLGIPGPTGVNRDGVGEGLESTSAGRAIDSGCCVDIT